MTDLQIDFESPARRRKRKTHKKLKAANKDVREQENRRDIIRSSTKIRITLQQRFSELSLGYNNISTDAKKLGMTMSPSNIHRYIEDNELSLSQFQILWLCVRWGVDIKFSVSRVEYNKITCLNNLKKLI
jgi:hypothetical protein